ncbi:MAG: hypothetical protein ACJ8FY_21430 [Gemmataceae bacterium]
MVAVSWFEFVILFFMGMGNNDAVSLIDAEDYFKAHDITVDVATLTNVASQDPADGKAQIAQLLAIRWLGEHADLARKNEAARSALDAIAKGKKAQDSLGFAKLYAARALAVLDGKAPPALPTVPDDSLRSEAFRWFPPQVHLVMGADLRATGKTQAKDEAFIRTLLKSMPPDFRREAYAFVDAVGNMRLDRVAMGMELEGQDGDPTRVYVRFTGAADRKRLTEFISQKLKDAKTEEMKESKEPITLIDSPGNPPSFALIGDTDLILSGYTKQEDAKHQELVKQMLEIREGKKENVLTGPLADLLKKIPDRANSASAGELPDPLRDRLIKNKGPINAAPMRFLFSQTRDKAITLRGQATFKDEDQAKVFAGDLERLKAQGVGFLKAPPPGFPALPEGAAGQLRKSLEAAKIEAKKDAVTGSIEISQEVIKALQDIIETQVKSLAGR